MYMLIIVYCINMLHGWCNQCTKLVQLMFSPTSLNSSHYSRILCLTHLSNRICCNFTCWVRTLNVVFEVDLSWCPVLLSSALWVVAQYNNGFTLGLTSTIIHLSNWCCWKRYLPNFASVLQQRKASCIWGTSHTVSVLETLPKKCSFHCCFALWYVKPSSPVVQMHLWLLYVQIYFFLTCTVVFVVLFTVILRMI